MREQARQQGGVVAHMTAIVARMEKRFGVSFTTLRRWALKGGWAVVDQGLFSGANFLVNILLARWLPPEEYGAFAVALAVYYLLLNVHTAVLTEPMMVFGAGKYREHFRKYLGMLLWGHWGVSALISLGLGVAALAAWYAGSRPLAQALAGLAVAAPFLLLFLFIRRASYVEMKPLKAAAGSALNLVMVIGGVILLWQMGWLSGFSGLLLLGVVGGIASVLLVSNLHPRVTAFEGYPPPTMVWANHWDYGKWGLFSMMAYWGAGQILILLIPVFLGLSASGAVAAILNLYRPVSLVGQSLSLVLLPTFSHWVNQGMSSESLKRRALRLAVFFGGGGGLYGAFLAIFAHPVLYWIYAGKYDEYQKLMLLFALSTTFSMVTNVFVMLLKAYERINVATLAWGVAAAVAVITGIPLMLTWGVEGAILALSLAYIMASLVAYAHVR